MGLDSFFTITPPPATLQPSGDNLRGRIVDSRPNCCTIAPIHPHRQPDNYVSHSALFAPPHQPSAAFTQTPARRITTHIPRYDSITIKARSFFLHRHDVVAFVLLRHSCSSPAPGPRTFSPASGRLGRDLRLPPVATSAQSRNTFPVLRSFLYGNREAKVVVIPGQVAVLDRKPCKRGRVQIGMNQEIV